MSDLTPRTGGLCAVCDDRLIHEGTFSERTRSLMCVTVQGRILVLTVCDSCDVNPSNLVLAWKRALLATFNEYNAIKPKDEGHRDKLRASLEDISNDPPIGVLRIYGKPEGVLKARL